MVEEKEPTSSLALVDNKPWYAEGVRFHCTGCAACCQGEGLVVIKDDEDLENMAAALSISVDDFIQKYTQMAEGHLCLIDKPHSTDCIFLEGKACRVYEGRPKQCRTFPFWQSVMRSKRCWDEEKVRCEGLDHPEGKHFSLEEIEAGLSQ